MNTIMAQIAVARLIHSLATLKHRTVSKNTKNADYNEHDNGPNWCCQTGYIATNRTVSNNTVTTDCHEQDNAVAKTHPQPGYTETKMKHRLL